MLLISATNMITLKFPLSHKIQVNIIRIAEYILSLKSTFHYFLDVRTGNHARDMYTHPATMVPDWNRRDAGMNPDDNEYTQQSLDPHTYLQ